jgi:broad-specificity NMP kinase
VTSEPGKVAIVGVCASGKTALTKALRERGYDARSLAQEHSYVGGMWRAHGRPDLLIYLDAGPETINERLERDDWDDAVVAEQHRRLGDARAQCDLYVRTDGLTEEQVLERVLAFLQHGGEDSRS